MRALTPHQLAALDNSRHLALTANAGSGKTFVLARKYLNAIINDGFDISTIAAITFTEKAASELYFKISLLIDEYLQESHDPVVKKLLEKVRRQLVSANISTIHSFCTSILRDYPVEANLDARFIPVDEVLSGELVEMSVEETIRSAFGSSETSELVKYLVRVFNSKNKLSGQIVKMINNRKNVYKITDMYKLSGESELSGQFREIFNQQFSILWDKIKQEFIASMRFVNNSVLDIDNANKIALEINPILQELENSTDPRVILNSFNKLKQKAFTKDLSIRKRGYINQELYLEIKGVIPQIETVLNEFREFDDFESDQNSELELARFGKKILVIFEKALNTYEMKKKQEGFIDYEDILLHTKILLQNESVQKELAEKFKFIMVDEYQDTNEIQYQIFLPILDYLKKGKLFIVGDEKQSIYKFRDAEIEIFDQTKEDIKKSEGDDTGLLILPDSFRMAPEICAFCNNLFNRVFKKPDGAFGEVNASELVCARVDDIKGKIEFLISRQADDIEAKTESELIAGKILNIIAEGNYSFKDITILVRKRKHFEKIEKEFLKNGIPYSIVGGRGFYQQQIIADIFNYLAFIVDTNNSTALVGILRSPFFTVSDSALFSISLKKGKNFWEKLKTLQHEKNIKYICDILQDNIQLSNSLTLSQLIEKIISDGNYLSVISNRYNGEQEIANINKLISIARTFNSTGFRNLYDFINYLKESIKNQSDESQGAILSNTDAVQLMTIHQSKGLEFPVVFIYNTNESGIPASIKSGEVAIDKKFGLLARLPAFNNYFDDYQAAPVVNIYNYFEEKKNNAELKRLLYVAVTRAKNELYISATVKENVFKRDSFIYLLSQGLENDFSGKEIVINEELKFLQQIENGFNNYTKKILLRIPIISAIDYEALVKETHNGISRKYEISIDKIINNEKGDIISASKVSVFNQCPLKYRLTYEFGFGKLAEELGNEISLNEEKFFIPGRDEEISDESDTNTDFNRPDLNLYFNPAVYGRLFHKAMEIYVRPDITEKFLRSELKDFPENEIYKIDKRLNSDLSNVYNSEFWQKINSVKKFKNEFEIYIREKDYFLHGIIDKIIFDDKRVKIIDYKTDDFEINDLKKHSEFYSMQLKFYLYIASRLFPGFDNFEGYLVFIKYPDNPFSISFNQKGIKDLQSEIGSVINDIRQGKSDKNLEHCRFCNYSDSINQCLINQGMYSGKL